MKYFTQTMTLMGTVRQIDMTQNSFEIECRSGDRFQVFVSTETVFSVLKNLDGLERDRVATPQGFHPQSPSHKLAKYIKPDALIAVQGIYQEQEDRKRFDARFVHLLHPKNGSYLNGIQLTSRLLLEQLLAQCLPGFDHQGETLGPPLLDARLHAMRSDGVDDQCSQWHSGARRAEPS
jgi:hypothetical protein